MFYYLYKITNWFNGKIYIGVHKTENLDDGYMGSGVYLKKAQKKYGIEYFTKEILQQFNNIEEFLKAESQVGNEGGGRSVFTYNAALGGQGGNILITDETRKKIKEALKGHILTEETKQKIRDARKNQIIQTGWHHTEETKKKISDTRKEKDIPNPMQGKQHSEETKQKMSDSLKGRKAPNKGIPHSEEVKQKMREAAKNRPPMTEEHKQKIADYWKKRRENK